MKLIKVIIILALTLFSHLALSWDGVIYQVDTQTEITASELYTELALADVIVIGEKHYTTRVQEMEGEILEQVMSLKSGEFFLGWEFLNHTDSTKNDLLWQDVKDKKITIEEFLTQTQGFSTAKVYEPLLQAVLNNNAKLYGLNLSRAEKSPVSQNGITALDPALLPPDFELGGANYYERFEAVMSGHVPAQKIQNYYEAQCLVDDVMAYKFLEAFAVPNTTGFMVAGHFHTDYNDGVVARLNTRIQKLGLNLKVSTVRLVDASIYQESELLNLLNDSTYGNVADFVIFVNEPAP